MLNATEIAHAYTNATVKYNLLSGNFRLKPTGRRPTAQMAAVVRRPRDRISDRESRDRRSHKRSWRSRSEIVQAIVEVGIGDRVSDREGRGPGSPSSPSLNERTRLGPS